MSSVRPSVCDTVHYCAQGWCRGFQVFLLCSWEGTSYSLCRTLLLSDVLFSNNTQQKKRTAKIPTSKIAMGSMATRQWLLQLWHFLQFASVTIPYIMHSMICRSGDSYASCDFQENLLLYHTHPSRATSIVCLMLNSIISQ